MLLGFKTELKLNDRQRTQLTCALWSSASCLKWGLRSTKNLLDRNKNHHNEKLKFPAALEEHKLLVASVKPENRTVKILGDNNSTAIAL